jgi:hypothetical protein
MAGDSFGRGVGWGKMEGKERPVGTPMTLKEIVSESGNINGQFQPLADKGTQDCQSWR